MSKKSKTSASPNYSGVSQASSDSAYYSYKLGEDQLAWAKSQASSNQSTTDTVVTQLLKDDQQSNQWAQEDRKTYEDTFKPLELEYAAKAKDWATPAKQEEYAGRAQASVAQQFESARTASQDQLESYGVDPSQTRFAALDLQSRVAEAAASASAGNDTRLKVEEQGMQYLKDAIGIGNTKTSNANTEVASSTNSGNSAVNNSLATTASGVSSMGSATQWQSLGNQAVSQWGSSLTQGYDTYLAGQKQKQSESSGLGNLLGLALGAGAKYATGGTFAEGGSVPGAGAQPATPASSGGAIAVPVSASPSRGAALDDVPARLTPGEFVIPRDVALWKGEEFFQKLIEGSRKQRPQAPAQPGSMPPQQQAPQQALPT